jgi:drug/metabolite transporter (DMT)-like permease
MTKSEQSAGRRHAAPWALGSALGYAASNVFDRVAMGDADPLVGPFLRGLPSLILGIVLVWKNRTLGQLQRRSANFVGGRAILSFVWAGLLSTLGLFAYYFAMRVGGVSVTTPVLETWVIWGTLGAWLFLRERLRGLILAGWVLIALGLGALIWGQLRGQPVSPNWYWAIPLAGLAAISYGVSGVLWRDGQLRGAHQSTAILVHFVTSVAVSILGLVALGRAALILTTAWRYALALLTSGVLSGIIAVYCIFTALRLMEAARVYAFSSLTPLVATLLAHFFLREYLNLLILLGVLLISAGVGLTQIFQPKPEQGKQDLPSAESSAP